MEFKKGEWGSLEEVIYSLEHARDNPGTVFNFAAAVLYIAKQTLELRQHLDIHFGPGPEGK